MKSPLAFCVTFFFLLAGCGDLSAARSDLTPITRRKVVVDLGLALAEPKALEPLSKNLKHPFSPPGFGEMAPEEVRARAVAAAAAAAVVAEPSKPTTAQELLKLLGGRIKPSGTLSFNGETVLLLKRSKLRVGSQLTVEYEGSEYDLELIDIQPSSFTLRLQGAEYTRPIKLGK